MPKANYAKIEHLLCSNFWKKKNKHHCEI